MLGIVGVTGATASAFSVVPGMYMPGAALMMAAGGAAGGYIGNSVEPMKLPQTVAAFHSLVGGAATFASIASFLAHPDAGAGHRIAAIAGDSIGMITLTGSLIAYAKLDGKMSSKEINLPGKNMINAGMLASQLGMAAMFMGADVTGGTAILLASAGLSGAMGAHLVASV